MMLLQNPCRSRIRCSLWDDRPLKSLVRGTTEQISSWGFLEPNEFLELKESRVQLYLSSYFTLLYSCREIGFCFWIQRRCWVKRLWLFGPCLSSVVTCVWLRGVFSHSGTSSSSLVYNSSTSDLAARLLHQHVFCLWPLTSLSRRSRSGWGSSSCVPGINTSLTLCDRLKCECLNVLTAVVKVIIHAGEDDVCI